MKQLVTLSQLRLLAERIKKYFNELLKGSTISATDDGEGNVTITINIPDA